MAVAGRDRLRVALVGCGAMGARHARTVAGDPGAELVAVIDSHPERAGELAERHGCRAERVVPREVDVVIVATPTTSHVDVASPLLARGQWCLVEKPLAQGWAAARAAGCGASRGAVGRHGGHHGQRWLVDWRGRAGR